MVASINRSSQQRPAAGKRRAPDPGPLKERQQLVPANERLGRKVRATFHVSAELLEELRDVVVALSGPPDRLTLSDLAEGALRREVHRLKQVHQRGERFAKREHQLRGGRPIR